LRWMNLKVLYLTCSQFCPHFVFYVILLIIDWLLDI
jgi:hypothetical protein